MRGLRVQTPTVTSESAFESMAMGRRGLPDSWWTWPPGGGQASAHRALAGPGSDTAQSVCAQVQQCRPATSMGHVWPSLSCRRPEGAGTRR